MLIETKVAIVISCKEVMLSSLLFHKVQNVGEEYASNTLALYSGVNAEQSNFPFGIVSVCVPIIMNKMRFDITKDLVVLKASFTQ